MKNTAKKETKTTHIIRPNYNKSISSISFYKTDIIRSLWKPFTTDLQLEIVQTTAKTPQNIQSITSHITHEKLLYQLSYSYKMMQ